MIVEDARADARFVDNALVTGSPFMRFYAGMPIVSRDGFALGALCVIDVVPRRLTAAQEAALRTLAEQTVARLELRRTARELRELEERLAVSQQNVRERTLENQRLRQANEYDPLTGLLSRPHFERCVRRMLDDRRRTDIPIAVLVLDVDAFHEVNESYGTAVGDRMLRAVATVVSTLAGDAVVARLDADKFGVLLQSRDSNDAIALAEALIRSFARPFQIDNDSIGVSSSAGIAYATDAEEKSSDLLGEADTALERARRAGGGTFRVYHANINVAAVSRVAIRDNIRVALANDEFTLHYQPKIDLRSDGVVGCEALIRWKQGERGMTPGEFIPIAERSGMIVPMGEWVIREACRQYSAWRAAGLTPVPIALNISAAQFARSDVLAFLRERLEEFDLPPQALEIEITEGMLLEISDELIASLQGIQAAGIGIALDDFGTGFSSLGYLHRLPLSLLKVDQMFVRGALENPSDLAIVRSMVHLAQQLGLRTVAEGVETSEQLAFVIECGCDEAQGYIFSPPVGAPEFAAYLAGSDRAIAVKTRAARQLRQPGSGSLVRR